MQFTPRTPIEDGFDVVFETEIQPKLVDLESVRHGLVRKGYRNAALAVGVAVVIWIAVFLIWGTGGGWRFSPVAVIGGGIAAYIAFHGAGGHLKSSLLDAIMPAITEHVGNLTYSHVGQSFRLDTMKDMKLLPRHDEAARRNYYKGTHCDAGFEMVHAVLTTVTENDNDSRSRTVEFSGLILRIDLPQPAPCQIALMRDRGGIGNKLAETFSFGSTRSQPKVTIDDARFEAAFEVYAADPDAAAGFLSPYIDRLMQIGDEHGGGQGAQAFVAGFSGGSFYIALTREATQLKAAELNTSVTEIEEDLHAIFADISVAHSIVEHVVGAST